MVESRSLKKEMFYSRTNRGLRNLYFLWTLKTLMLLFFSLCCIYNLSLVRNVCKAVPTSLFQPHNGFNELLEMHFEFPFNLLVNWQWLLNRSIMVCNKNLVRWWGPRTRILPSLFHRLLGWFSITERERQLMTARANQTTGLTNGTAANWAPGGIYWYILVQHWPPPLRWSVLVYTKTVI